MVVTEDAANFAEQIGITLFETSAKDNLNVESVSIGSFTKHCPAPDGGLPAVIRVKKIRSILSILSCIRACLYGSRAGPLSETAR